jgi:DNA mismatch repair ATPase MutS
MAGKSTFLRTVAVNYILAMTGAPVCAEEMTFTPMNLFTSMRTTDSLATNESYFYAELRRLRLLQQMGILD